jgi:hypothetical protein
MNVYAKLLDSSVIHPHHGFIKALTKRENHHLPYSAWSARPVFSFHQQVVFDECLMRK